MNRTHGTNHPTRLAKLPYGPTESVLKRQELEAKKGCKSPENLTVKTAQISEGTHVRKIMMSGCPWRI